MNNWNDTERIEEYTPLLSPLQKRPLDSKDLELSSLSNELKQSYIQPSESVLERDPNINSDMSLLIPASDESYNQPSVSVLALALAQPPLSLQLSSLLLLLSDESVALASVLSSNDRNNKARIPEQHTPLLLLPLHDSNIWEEKNKVTTNFNPPSSASASNKIGQSYHHHHRTIGIIRGGLTNISHCHIANHRSKWHQHHFQKSY